MAPDAEYYEGDEVGTPLDFCSPRAEQGLLHRHFLALTEGRGLLRSARHHRPDDALV